MNISPSAAGSATFSNATGIDTSSAPAAVVKFDAWYWNAAPAVSRTPALTSKVYWVLGSSGSRGRSTIASPPPDVFTAAATSRRSAVRNSFTVSGVTVFASTTYPPLGSSTSAATKPSSGTLPS